MSSDNQMLALPAADPIVDGPAAEMRRCQGQVRYLGFNQADKAMKNIKRFKPRDSHKGKVKPFRCRHCQGWHLGHVQDS